MRGLHIACGCLDLRLLGIAHDSAVGVWLESAKFAFMRAALLWVVAGVLFFTSHRRGAVAA